MGLQFLQTFLILAAFCIYGSGGWKSERACFGSAIVMAGCLALTLLSEVWGL